MKKIFSIVMIMTAVVSPLRAEIETTVGADLVSEYIWRGAKCGDAAIQPTLGVSMAGIDLSFWGSVGVANTLLHWVWFPLRADSTVLKDLR